ncbi:MAG TPA: Mur ligase family protein [Chloroflexota bacterium]|nr:Mur ligase family protein [Chloroflexota bacterium]
MIHDYDEAVAYLEHLVATPVCNEPGAGLARARLMLAHVGDPQERFATLHVTGSSGKGSTAAMAAAILRAAGYRTGIFSSPHLEAYTERIAVDGAPIAPSDWTRLLNRLHPFVEQMAGGALSGYTLGRPALLQVLWPMAALYFAERGVEVAVVEVGMGGRYDSTNANNARVAVVTNVSLEHTQHLGATVAEIAYHKAGVAKPSGIVITAAQDPAARAPIAAECARQGATLWRATPEGDGEVRFTDDEAGLCIATPARTHGGLRLGLRGRHQHANAACAVAAVDALEALGIVRVAGDAVSRGLAAAYVPGRLEQVADDPVTLLDGAHNPDAARALAAALRDLFPGQPLVLLLGILADKDVAAMVEALAPLARAVVVTEPPWEGRMGQAHTVAHAAERYLPDVIVVPAVGAAFTAAQQRARDLGGPLVVAGSLILVGAVRALVHGQTSR